jgi:phosphoglycerol transferase
MVPTLGAPDGANWNDFPQTEDFLYAFCGALAAVLGLAPAANLSLLLAFIWSGLGFYWACRLLRYPALWSVVGAFLFAFSRYAFVRAFDHLELSYYGHLPLALVATWWLSAGAIRRFNDKRAIFVFAIAAWSGLQNAYYTYLLAQLLGLALLVNWARSWKDPGQRHSALIGFVSLAILFGAFLLGNIDTLTYHWAHGWNSGAVVRNFADTEIFALRPIEMFLRFGKPAWPILGGLSQRYVESGSFRGEAWGPYLGVIGIFGLLALACFTFVRVARRSGVGMGVPTGAYQIMWILLLSTVGGINAMAALCGLDLFRGTNRYSIVILAIALFFFVRIAALYTRGWRWPAQLGLASLVLGLGLTDEITWKYRITKSVMEVRARVDSDKTFCATLERELPHGSAVFQLPFAEYPEQGPIGDMDGYEHIRPFLYTNFLRFSYGDDKGRKRSAWQRQIAAMPGLAAVEALRQKGFAAVIIDRDGYSDRGAALVEQFQRAGATAITEAPKSDFIALKLP